MKDKPVIDEVEEESLIGDDVALYQPATMRIGYVRQDRTDLQRAVRGRGQLEEPSHGQTLAAPQASWPVPFGVPTCRPALSLPALHHHPHDLARH